MDIASHLEKVERFERARATLDPITEFEMWYWMSLSGGTSAVNAALHASKLTDDGDYFCTQSVVRQQQKARVKVINLYICLLVS